jgi:hypothetical protein
MDKVKIETVTDTYGVEYEWVNIDHGNGEFTSMSKATYEEQQTAQAMPQFMPEAVEIIPEEIQSDHVILEA